jgi:hypothetical protein
MRVIGWALGFIAVLLLQAAAEPRRFETKLENVDATSGRFAAELVFALPDHDDQWGEAEITWNNAPKNDAASPGGVQPEGTVLLAEVQLPGIAEGEPVEFESEELTKYLNWKAGALPDAYGTGAAKDSMATFIVAASDRSPTAVAPQAPGAVQATTPPSPVISARTNAASLIV